MPVIHIRNKGDINVHCRKKHTTAAAAPAKMTKIGSNKSGGRSLFLVVTVDGVSDRCNPSRSFNVFRESTCNPYISSKK